jgi:copper(I)-binding protein
MRKIIAALLVLLGSFALSGCSSTNNDLVITDAWVRSSEYSDHVGGMTGIFAKLTNNTDHDITLVGGSTDIAPMVQTHEVVDGMMQEKKGGIVVAAGQTVTLEPGGLHVMLMDLKRPILSGDKINFTFKTDHGEQTFELTAKVSAGGDEDYKG